MFRCKVPHLSRSIYIARGLRKAPETYMVSPTGAPYPPQSSVLEPVNQFLGSDYKLPENLVLQAVTHKSFAHGKAPYNEKLAILGNNLLRLETSRAIVDITGTADLPQQTLELPASSLVTSQICKMANMGDALYWKPANNNSKTVDTVQSRAVNAIVGAVVAHYGMEKGQRFVQERLLNGKYSLFELAEKV